VSAPNEWRNSDLSSSQRTASVVVSVMVFSIRLRGTAFDFTPDQGRTATPRSRHPLDPGAALNVLPDTARSIIL